MTIKLEHLRVFVAVADAGTLADAGQRIGRTAAAISMTLNQIEDELGGPLFEGERKSRLTHLGRYVLARARRSVAEHDAALSDIERFARGEEGIVRVAAVPSAASRLLPPAVDMLDIGAASVRLDLRDTDSASVAEAVRSGNVDFGIASRPDPPCDLATELLLEDPFRLVCAAGHPLAKKITPVHWHEIEPSEFIANGLCRHIPSSELERLAEQAPLMVHNTTSLMAFVTRGYGVTLLPSLAASEAPRFAALPLADPSAVRRLYILSRIDESPGPASLRLLDGIRKAASGITTE